MSNIAEILAPLAFSTAVAVLGFAIRSINPRSVRRRQLQEAFEATKSDGTSSAHHVADVLLASYLIEQDRGSGGYLAAGWARNASILGVIGTVLLVGAGMVAAQDDEAATELELTYNLVTVFNSGPSGVLLALGLSCLVLGVLSLLASLVVHVREDKPGGRRARALVSLDDLVATRAMDPGVRPAEGGSEPNPGDSTSPDREQKPEGEPVHRWFQRFVWLVIGTSR